MCISLIAMKTYAQLSFCQGNYGDPVFTEDFGTGTQDSALPSGSTVYTYANGAEPLDGFYTVSSNTNYFDWFVTNDRTRNDINGRMMIVNASFSEDEIYLRTITGLCENTTYEMSAWLLNLTPEDSFCGSDVIPVNLRFEVWDSSYTSVLAFGSTGDIYGTSEPLWSQHALVFQTLANQTSIRLKISTNRPGGCGNDFAVDDIVIKSCSDDIVISDDSNGDHINLCSSQIPYSDTLIVTPDNSVFNTHFYQWQVSTDAINWTDVVGETNESINLSGISETSFFRAKVAESSVNLSSTDCVILSDVYQITVNDAPSPPEIECWETATFNQNNCTWYVTGTQPEPPTNLECWESLVFNSTTCEWEITGTQPEAPLDLLCWQTAVFNELTCEWEIEGVQPIEYIEEFAILCEGFDVTLTTDSNIDNPNYEWVSGEVTQSITVSTGGSYTVEVTDGCLTEIVTFIVSKIENPIIETISSIGSSIIVDIINQGSYQYSLDGLSYQDSNIFAGITTGIYTIHVRPLGCDTVITEDYFHFYIQKFLTPNNDGKNDALLLNLTQFFSTSEVQIFNRYGKLLYSAKNSDVIWDGTFNGTELPTSDYWYRIVLDKNVFLGHFTLKR